MGEIRGKVKLTNAADVLAPARSARKPKGNRSVEVEALVDTRAVMSVIPIHLVQKLGLGIRSRRMAKYADGRTDEVGVTTPLLFEI